jgi:signal transduction histidine kinase
VTIFKQSILLILLSLPVWLWAQQPIITITDASKIISIDSKISILRQPHLEALKIEDMVRLDSLFTPNETEVANIGDWTGTQSWWKIIVENQTNETLFLSVLPALTDSFELYKPTTNGYDIERTGRMVAFKGTNISPPNHLVELKCTPFQKQVFYIHVTAFISARIKMAIAGQNKLTIDSQLNSLINGFIFGLIFLVCLLSTFFYFIHKQTTYIWFSVFLMTMSIVSFYFMGYWQILLFPQSYWMNQYSPLLVNLPSIFSIRLSLTFSSTEIISPKLAKMLKTMLAILIVNSFIGFFYSIGLSIWVIYILMPPCILTTIIASYKSYRKGNNASQFYIWGFAFFGIYLIAYLLDDSGLISFFTLSNNIFLYAVGLQAIMLLFAMIRHINDFKRDKEEADAQLIKSLDAQRQMISEHNILLENQVIERTKALTETLSELEKKEEELNIYADKLKTSNSELLDFASIISHDLKAPIRNTTSFIQLLIRKNRDKFDTVDKEYVDFIVKSSSQSVQLVDDLLNYSKLDKNIGDPQTIDFSEIVNNCRLTLRSLMEARPVEIIMETIPVIQAHRSLIVMLIQNLINNGIKYNDSAEPQIKIGHFKNIKKENVFYIQDNGIGIPSKYKEEVFKMFRRVHTKQTYEGTGIGLAFCKRIIDYYKGRIWFESTERAGTTFFFTLPNAIVIEKPMLSEVN